MSDSSLALIISCAAVGGLLFIGLAVRIGLCIRRRRHKPVPLPPARPLTVLHTSPWNANSSTYPSSYSSSKFDLSSSSSLSPTTYHLDSPMMHRGAAPGRARNVYRQFSGSTLNTEEIPLHQPPSPITRASSPMADATLVPPQPSFFASSGMNSNWSSAQLSLNSSTEESEIASYPPQWHQSMTAFPSDPLSEDPSNFSPSATPCPGSYSPRMNGRHSRRQSVAGSVSTVQTSRSMRSARTQTTVRGPPHKPYSRVEIVLPAPLAPRDLRGSSYLHELYDGSSIMNTRQSMCDPWIQVGREGIGSPVNNSSRPPSRERERERGQRTVSQETHSAPRSRQARRPSASSISSFTAHRNSLSSPNPNPYPSRPASVTSQTHTRVQPSVDMSDLPPVPRVPSVYNSHTYSPVTSSPSSPVLALSDSITGNGTLKGLGSDGTIRNRTLPSKTDIKLPPEPEPPVTADGVSIPPGG